MLMQMLYGWDVDLVLADTDLERLLALPPYVPPAMLTTPLSIIWESESYTCHTAFVVFEGSPQRFQFAFFCENLMWAIQMLNEHLAEIAVVGVTAWFGEE